MLDANVKSCSRPKYVWRCPQPGRHNVRMGQEARHSTEEWQSTFHTITTPHCNSNSPAFECALYHLSVWYRTGNGQSSLTHPAIWQIMCTVHPQGGSPMQHWETGFSRPNLGDTCSWQPWHVGGRSYLFWFEQTQLTFSNIVFTVDSLSSLS